MATDGCSSVLEFLQDEVRSQVEAKKHGLSSPFDDAVRDRKCDIASAAVVCTADVDIEVKGIHSFVKFSPKGAPFVVPCDDFGDEDGLGFILYCGPNRKTMEPYVVKAGASLCVAEGSIQLSFEP